MIRMYAAFVFAFVFCAYLIEFVTYFFGNCGSIGIGNCGLSAAPALRERKVGWGWEEKKDTQGRQKCIGLLERQRECGPSAAPALY